MSGRDELSPYAPPDLSSYPQRLRREPPMEDDRRLSSWWWLLPLAMFPASFLLPTVEQSGRGLSVVIDGRIAGIAASIAVACVIGAINSFRKAGVAHEDRDFVLATWRYGMAIAAVVVGLFCFVNAAVMFAALLPRLVS